MRNFFLTNNTAIFLGTLFVGLFFCLSLLSSPLDHRCLLVCTLFFLFMIYSVWMYALKKQAPLFKHLLFIIIVSLSSQLILFFQAPYFNDFFRYLWDGHVTLQGFNPYLTTPLQFFVDSNVMNLTEVWYWDQLYFRWISGVYGPTAQIFFFLSALFSSYSAIALKFLFFLLNVGSLYLGVRILDALSKPRFLIAFFALNPLWIFETMSSGHLESMIIFFLFAATYAYLRFRPILTGAFFSALVLIKFFPLILLPAILVSRKRWFMILLSFILFSVLLYFPFVFDAHSFFDVFASLSAFSESWIFTPGLFDVLFSFLTWISLPQTLLVTKILSTVLLMLSIFILYFWHTTPYRSQSRFFIRLFPFSRTWKNPSSLFSFIYATFLVLLLTSSVVFSWYTLWLVCLLPFIKYKTTGIVFSFVSIFQYLLIFFDGETYRYMYDGHTWWFQLLFYIPVFIALFYDLRAHALSIKHPYSS
jgi:alpha-1,6-mannosyltransferase